MTVPPRAFSVFLSYNSEDAELVAKIAEYLEDQANLKPWIDRWQMIPGNSSLEQLQQGLTDSQSCAVFVGASGEGIWQKKEVEVLLRRQIQEQGFRHRLGLCTL